MHLTWIKQFKESLKDLSGTPDWYLSLFKHYSVPFWFVCGTNSNKTKADPCFYLQCRLVDSVCTVNWVLWHSCCLEFQLTATSSFFVVTVMFAHHRAHLSPLTLPCLSAAQWTEQRQPQLTSQQHDNAQEAAQLDRCARWQLFPCFPRNQVRLTNVKHCLLFVCLLMWILSYKLHNIFFCCKIINHWYQLVYPEAYLRTWHPFRKK